ncbi:uncharacterized protein BHQ10_009784 [Talaromyces amestolkiae]|uniref:Oxidoreductase-like domain-containing protein n=1 Tax=Talaromyces amestolkiae TaxID=1196081 RepID=A0A364LDA4_TALAM|nr:uncharacterized protein BHQ10_009784 [Talaromyces amestolkiae]RAO73772.1 hypothetical protein BHQ10_009784 [Talaromyces amestolkiae]
MERATWAPSRRLISKLFDKSRSCRLTERYATIGRHRNRGHSSESASRRSFSHTRLNNDTATRRNSETQQAYPLSGYYSDLLSFQQPPHHPKSPSSQPPPSSAASAEKEPTKEQKLSIVFGTRLAGPGYQSTRYNPETTPPESTWKQINGVPIPPRPTEPDNCCMSGCVHCVWDDYRDDLEHWASRVRDARLTATAAGADTRAKGKDMRQTPRKEVASASTSMDDDGGGSEANWELPAVPGALGEEDLFKGIPVGIREFMKTEKKLREKKSSNSLQS